MVIKKASAQQCIQAIVVERWRNRQLSVNKPLLEQEDRSHGTHQTMNFWL